MNNKERILYGLLITLFVFAVSTFSASKLNLNINFIPPSFVTHSIMLVLSMVFIYGLRIHVNYKISRPRFKEVLKPIVYGFLVSILANISISILTKSLGGEVEMHAALSDMTPLKFFVFVFIYASLAEELLFRGFLLNILRPLNPMGIVLFKRKLSLSVIISAFAFGLAHLILISTGASGFFLMRIVIFTTLLGLIAGYYQEKYDNNAFAILVHMSGNFIGVIGMLIVNLNT